jgi:DnaJ domain/Exodeoxyribonuclease X-like C-terminal
VTRREPHTVLGLSPGASAGAIKAAWRRLAREHHPDLSGSDPVAARAATRRMAEINAAYEQLRSSAVPGGRGPAAGDPGRSPSGPPPPKATRPVTARLDTTDVLRPRNATTSRADGRRAHPTPHPPIRARAADTGPRRASDPNGPLVRSRIRRFRRPRRPSLEAARAREMAFGKFHGHTLAEIAAFEPSYIDWLATAITRDPDLQTAARVLREDLDRQGVVRRVRPNRVPPGPPTD